MEKIVYQGIGERIDVFLTTKFHFARNFFHHIIVRAGVKIVNKSGERVVKKSYKLKSGDEIIIDDLQRYLSPEILDEAPQIDIPIVLEEEDFLVLNKPKGVLSHPNSVWDVHSPSVVGFLYHNYKTLPTIGNFIRAGLIHRLDKETDGLMIVAKTEAGLAHFKQLFQEKSESSSLQEKELAKLHKFYRAMSHLTFLGQEFLETIQGSLPYYIQQTVIPKVPHSVPKMGITKILGFEKKDDQVMLDIEILTGRTHQIRYHLSQKGLPIVGDFLYGREENLDMCLTAYKLIFEDLRGHMREVKI